MYRLLQFSGSNVRYSHLTSFKNICENIEMSCSRCQSCKKHIKYLHSSNLLFIGGILIESVRSQSTLPIIERSPKKRRKRKLKSAELLVGMNENLKIFLVQIQNIFYLF